MSSALIFGRFLTFFACFGILAMLQACAIMPHTGPSRIKVQRIEKNDDVPGVTLVEVNDEVARKLKEGKKHAVFSKVFAGAKQGRYVIAPGDTLEITIWETPPAILFGTAATSLGLGSIGVNSQTLPPQMVMEDGSVTIPFAGRVKVSGRTPGQVEAEIGDRLEGKANNPQALVRILHNPTSEISVIGDVARSCNIPLTPKGEKLLDALARAGGTAPNPVTKVSVQLSRKGVNATMPLEAIVDDPKENLQLMPGDVITALYQPLSFSVLGAAGASREIPFEAKGISMAQALSRASGINDNKADPHGVFIFRFEDANLVDRKTDYPTIDGKVPVVYQLDFDNPATFFAAQNFPMQDKDLMYVANMPTAELQKFLGMVGLVLTPALNLGRYQLQVSQ